MAAPIYKVWFSKFKAPWYELTTEEQNKLMEQDSENLKQLGIESIIFCFSGWSSEGWPFWGVEKYPDLETVQKHADFLLSLNWFKYFESKTSLGTVMTLP